jgi:[ribosomal protein S5]-alanine N-acetyltransferase
MGSAVPAFIRRFPGAAASAPTIIETDRLVLRRPLAGDAATVFARYGSDPAVTRFLGWPTHQSLADARKFLAFCRAEWAQRGVGPYLIHAREDGELLGSVALGMESPRQATVGYLLARDAWGQGYATEALSAIRDLASRIGVHRLYAMCHVDNRASGRVMEKCGFRREGILRGRAQFPNLPPGVAADVLCYAAFFEPKPRPW